MAVSQRGPEAVITSKISEAEHVLFDQNNREPESYPQYGLTEKIEFLTTQLYVASRRTLHRPSPILDSAIGVTRLCCKDSDRDGNDYKRKLDTLCEMLNARITPCPIRSTNNSDWQADFQEALDTTHRAISLSDQNDPELPSRLARISSLWEDAYDLGGTSGSLEMAIDYLRRAASVWRRAHSDCIDKAVSQIFWLQSRLDKAPSIACILEMPIENLHLSSVSLDKATSGRFRFLDCEAFVKHKVYRIFEFTHLPTRKYTAISYPWRGLGPSTESGQSQSFSVLGASEADAISIHVLQSACLASQHLNSGLLWLDQLCILQTDRSDKNWQIKNMHAIYQHSKFCLAIPGGLVRLAGLDEETIWIHRAWTLQEALAPSSVFCLFRWISGDACMQHISRLYIQEVSSNTAAIAPLADVLLARDRIGHFVYPDTAVKLKICILGDKARSVALEDALHETDEAKHIAVWSSAYMRTSSRPVDMILSIMGLLGITLNPCDYAAHDRHKATLDLMRVSLNKGARASWLGIAPLLAISPLLSIIPMMPESSVDGKALVNVRGQLKSTEHFSLWWIKGLPRGRMNNEGYFTFRGSVRSIQKIKGCISNTGPVFTSTGGDTEETWEVATESAQGSMAVVLGTLAQRQNGVWPSMIFGQNTALMILERDMQYRHYCAGYAFVSDILTSSWDSREVTVGGPAPSSPDQEI